MGIGFAVQNPRAMPSRKVLHPLEVMSAPLLRTVGKGGLTRRSPEYSRFARLHVLGPGFDKPTYVVSDITRSLHLNVEEAALAVGPIHNRRLLATMKARTESSERVTGGYPVHRENYALSVCMYVHIRASTYSHPSPCYPNTTRTPSQRFYFQASGFVIV